MDVNVAVAVVTWVWAAVTEACAVVHATDALSV